MQTMQDLVKNLGRRATDRVSGLTGVITSVSFDVAGCIQYAISPPANKDGKRESSYWVDIKHVDLAKQWATGAPAFEIGKEIGAAEKPAPRA
jgi:hypothetical protein